MQILQSKKLLMLKKCWRVISDKHPLSSHSRHMITGVHLSLTNITITLNYSGKPEEYTEVRIKIILFKVGYAYRDDKEIWLTTLCGCTFSLDNSSPTLTNILPEIPPNCPKPNKSCNSSSLLKPKIPSENIS